MKARKLMKQPRTEKAGKRLRKLDEIEHCGWNGIFGKWKR